MRIVYLDAWALGDADLSPLSSLGDLAVYASTTPGELAGRVSGADVVVTNKVLIGADELAAAPRCRLVVASATGTDHIDASACERRGVSVANVAGYATESVAQYTLGAALYLGIRLGARDAYVADGSYSASGRWSGTTPPWRELAGRWGIIGLGAIGRRVAALARALGCEPVFFSATGPREREGLPQLPLDELLATASVISVHAPGVPRYRGLLDEAALTRTHPRAIVISAGRGGVVDEGATARALREGRLGAAAFDVFEREPIAPDNPLLAADIADRVLLSAHMAWTSDQARRKLVAGIAARIAEHGPWRRP